MISRNGSVTRTSQLQQISTLTLAIERKHHLQKVLTAHSLLNKRSICLFKGLTNCDIIKVEIIFWVVHMDINSLNRFIKAQESVYQIALKEVKNAKKTSHWMWFVFPQLRGLGKSSMAYLYGISDLVEAKSYLAHPILSARLYEICDALLDHKGTPAYVILGDIDAMKLKSSMTLFALASKEPSVFHQVLDSFFDGEMDEATLKLLGY